MRKWAILAMLFFASPLFAQSHSNTVNWTAPTSGPAPTGYNVYKYASACPAQILLTTATKLTTTPITALTYTDTTPTAGSVSCYFITSVDASGESAASSTIQLTTPVVTAQQIANPPTIGASNSQ
jgi:hypothetical protein